MSNISHFRKVYLGSDLSAHLRYILFYTVKKLLSQEQNFFNEQTYRVESEVSNFFYYCLNDIEKNFNSIIV